MYSRIADEHGVREAKLSNALTVVGDLSDRELIKLEATEFGENDEISSVSTEQLALGRIEDEFSEIFARVERWNKPKDHWNDVELSRVFRALQSSGLYSGSKGYRAHQRAKLKMQELLQFCLIGVFAALALACALGAFISVSKGSLIFFLPLSVATIGFIIAAFFELGVHRARLQDGYF